MNRPTPLSRTPNRSALFHAITLGLVVGAATAAAQAAESGIAVDAWVPCDAALESDCNPGQPALHGRAPASSAFAGNGFNNPSMQAQPQAVAGTVAATPSYVEAGVIGNPDSWVNDEFRLDWGLGAIKAQYAYARGLSGAGIRLGLMDSGTGFDHSEFAGKDNIAITMADVLADGSLCAKFRTFGPGTCFATRGDEVQLDYVVGFNANVPQNIRNIIMAGNYIKPGFNYESHGTHVAGTMAANRDGSGMHGVAFGANLAAARIFYDKVREWQRTATGYSVQPVLASPGPSLSAYAGGFRAMAAAGVRAVNHSWGYTVQLYTGAQLDSYYNFAGNRPLWETFRNGALDTGMLHVWSAGNLSEAPPAGWWPIAGLTASLPRLYPELEPYWLSVVNLTRTNDPANPYGLSSGSMMCGESRNWCVAAPGSLIASSVYGGAGNIAGRLFPNADGTYSLDITRENPTSDYAQYSGTSMAAPHVTGALGLLFERFPYLTGPQVRDILLTTATDIGAPGIDPVYGWGLINLQKAIEGYGQFRVDTDVVMARKAGGAHVWNDARVWDNWTNDIGGPGRFSFSSANGGWLRLSGNNSFNGLTVKGGTLELTGNNRLTAATHVNGGMLRLQGTLDGSALTINNGGVAVVNGRVLNAATMVEVGGLLTGAGTLGNTTVRGSIAPGNSIGTLTVNGNYVQAAGSRFYVEMQPPSATDKVQVNGTATLNGGTVVALRAPGVYGLGQVYNFLSATGGVNGRFAGVDNSNLGVFLQMALSYDANNAYARVIRAAALASVAGTRNQARTAGALDSLADSNGLLQRLVLLSAPEAMAAFDQLSGEVHPSLRSALAEDSRHVRNAALGRARTGHDAFTSQTEPTGFSAWAQATGKGGSVHGDGNAAAVDYNGSLFLAGADYQFQGGLRLGAMVGRDRTDVDVRSRGSKANADGTVFGVYAGQRFAGGFGLQGGLTEGSYDVDSSRLVGFPGFSATNQASHDAQVRQAFIEANYRFGGPSWEIEPYLQHAQVRVQSQGFAENGGASALTVGRASSSVDVTTAGVRFDRNLKGTGQEQTWLSLRGGLGYRHAGGDLVPASTAQFAGSNPFVVEGATLSNSATIGELGFAARLSDNSLLELGYNGQFSGNGNSHGAHARFSVKF